MRRVVAIAGLLVLMGAWPALADPPGNNGTVKIDGIELDKHPNNEPHPGCLFEVDFYGFGANLDAKSTFYAWPPTGKMQWIREVDTVLDDDDSTGGGSEAGYDGGTGLIDLSPQLVGIVPHPNQGFHVKLRVDVPEGSDSAAYSKYKVFWVTCEVYPPADTSTDVAGGSAEARSFDDTDGSSLPMFALIGLVLGTAGVLTARRLSAKAAETR